MSGVIKTTGSFFRKCSALLALGVAAAGVIFCSCNGMLATNDGGSGTGVGNGLVMGRVLYADSSAVQGAVVRLRTSNFLSDTSGIPSSVRNDTIATVATDATGAFRIDSIDTGKSYYVEVVDEKPVERGTLYKTIVVTQDTVRLETRIVTPVKMLTGTIIVSGMPKNAYVLIYGLERVDKTDSAGRFEIVDLPMGDCEEGECEYKLRILITEGTGAITAIDTELEIEFDSQGNILEVEIELDEDY